MLILFVWLSLRHSYASFLYFILTLMKWKVNKHVFYSWRRRYLYTSKLYRLIGFWKKKWWHHFIFYDALHYAVFTHEMRCFPTCYQSDFFVIKQYPGQTGRNLVTWMKVSKMCSLIRHGKISWEKISTKSRQVLRGHDKGHSGKQADNST